MRAENVNIKNLPSFKFPHITKLQMKVQLFPKDKRMKFEFNDY
jgi:hypothetical protein